MAQTSVEWLIMQLPVSIRVELYAQDIHEQAKEMYNIELGNAYEEGWKDASKEAMKEIRKYQ